MNCKFNINELMLLEKIISKETYKRHFLFKKKDIKLKKSFINEYKKLTKLNLKIDNLILYRTKSTKKIKKIFKRHSIKYNDSNIKNDIRNIKIIKYNKQYENRHN